MANAPQTSVARGLFREARPRQWIKNLLVFAAPFAAGALDDGDVLIRSLIAFVAFSMAASGTYFINDIVDRHADQEHETKRNRPIAAGIVSPELGVAVAVALLGGSLLVAFALSAEFALVLAAYVVVTISYSLALKHLPVVELGLLASGFILRAVGGGAATDIGLSEWFLMVTCFGALFIAGGKRFSELLTMAEKGGDHRPVLNEYSLSFLRQVRAVAASVTIMAYCLWAFDSAAARGSSFWYEMSIAPFVLAVLRYSLVVEEGRGGAPEEVFLSDRVLQILAAATIVLMGVAVMSTPPSL